MIEKIVIEFQKMTKYPLVDFLIKYRNFLSDSYPFIDQYYSGKVESIDNKHLVTFSELTQECRNVLSFFKSFDNKFANCGYWELMEYIDDLNDTLEKINKLPKFRRTFLGKRGYMPAVEVSSSVGSRRTMEDVSDAIKYINTENDDWINLMLNNDLNEADWEIDELKPISVFVNNTTDVVVTTILDIPRGKRIYGKDIDRKITLENNDVRIVEYEDNVEQKCDILLLLEKGDVPENMQFGRTLLTGSTLKSVSYPELVTNIRDIFLQNDLFEYANVKDITFNEGSLYVTVDIKTKYDYKTQKKIKI